MTERIKIKLKCLVSSACGITHKALGIEHLSSEQLSNSFCGTQKDHLWKTNEIMASKNIIPKTEMSAVRFVNEHESKHCSCEYCYKKFETVSTFFRHVSHAKLCFEHYGEEFIDAMREELRCNSKRKWFNANKDKVKKQRLNKNKNYWFSHSKRQTDEGRAFGNIFRKVFHEFKDSAADQIEEYCKERSNFVTLEIIEEALDKTFELQWDEYSLFGHEKDVLKELDDEESTLNIYFTKLEKNFEQNMYYSGKIDVYRWKQNQMYKIGTDLWKYSANMAFLNFYKEEDFKYIIESSQDTALDEIFLKLIVIENYFKDDLNDDELEKKLSMTYSALEEKEIIKRAREKGIIAELHEFMKEVMDKKVRCDGIKFKFPNVEQMSL